MATANRAWRTRWGGVESIVAAPTAAKAKAVTVRSALEVYDRRQVKFTEVRVRRAALFDSWAEADTTGRLWNELAVRREMEGVST